jgi:hypothetical protein
LEDFQMLYPEAADRLSANWPTLCGKLLMMMKKKNTQIGHDLMKKVSEDIREENTG